MKNNLIMFFTEVFTIAAFLIAFLIGLILIIINVMQLESTIGCSIILLYFTWLVTIGYELRLEDLEIKSKTNRPKKELK